MRNGVTLIELLVVVVILAILVSLAIGGLGLFGPQRAFVAEVVDKWTELDHENWTIYRIRTRTEAGEVETLDSRSVHPQLQVGQWYEFQVRGPYISEAKFVPSVPITLEQPNDQTMYYTIGRSNYANGPFVVVDPATRKLRNGQGVEIALPSTLQSRLQPLPSSKSS